MSIDGETEMIEDVIFGERYVKIQLDDDKELYWDIQEWTDDPDVLFSIANAIKLFYTDRDALYKIAK